MSIINCKFEDIFLRKESDMIMKEYNELNKLLSSKDDQANLEENEYKLIFQFNKSDVNNIQCHLEKSPKFFYINFYYDLNNRKKGKYIYLIREPYSFNFNGIDYIAFERQALANFLSEEYKKKICHLSERP